MDILEFVTLYLSSSVEVQRLVSEVLGFEPSGLIEMSLKESLPLVEHRGRR